MSSCCVIGHTAESTTETSATGGNNEFTFTQVKSQVTTRQAAERYGVPVNRSGMAYAPFHDDCHPSMKIDERFYCFGCHTTGDVIDFTAKLFDLSLYDAAKKLANDFNIQPLPPSQSTPIPKLPAAVIERKEEQSVLKS